MQGLFYKLLVFFSKIFGIPFFIIISRIIAAGYFFLFPDKVLLSVKFYRALFPNRSDLFYLLCTWKQYQNFTSAFLDRFMVMNKISYTSDGFKHFEKAFHDKSGAIILMSHLGNWEVAARLLKHRLSNTNLENIKMLLYMGARQKEEIERIQKDDLQKNNIKISIIDENKDSLYDVIDGIKILKSGGIISLAGDIVWKKEIRTVCVNFLNHKVFLPKIPYIFAILSGAPIFIFFTFKTGINKYHFVFSKPIWLKDINRNKRDYFIQKTAQLYADNLNHKLVLHPYEWYHFRQILVL